MGLILLLVPSAVSLRITGVNSFIRKGEWLEESGTCRVRPDLKLKMCRIQCLLW